jgi:hypothetical protein
MASLKTAVTNDLLEPKVKAAPNMTRTRSQTSLNHGFLQFYTVRWAFQRVSCHEFRGWSRSPEALRPA